MEVTQPGAYDILGNTKPATNPVPAPEQEKCLAPSIDRHVSEHDRWLVASLPEKGQREFSENVHQYIGQLGKDYLPGVGNAAG